MDPNVLVLAIVARAETVPGRTSLQKLSYFANEVLSAGIQFKPHFYGPYSPDISDRSDVLVAAHLLDEEIETGLFIRNGKNREWIRHTYSLTPDGIKYFDWLSHNKPVPGADLTRLVSALKERTRLDPDQLSKLAKVHFLRKQLAVPKPSPVDIARAAKKFGWSVPPTVARKNLTILGEISL